MVPFDLPRQSRDMLDRFMRVDISDIGGAPASSLIDGEATGPPTVVAGTPNSTAALQEQGEKIKDAVNRAYRKSGEVALVVVALAALAWGFFVCRSRRRRAGAGYKGLFSRDPDEDDGAGGQAFGLNGRVGKHSRENGDLEAAAFDENELDDLGSDSEEDYDTPSATKPSEKKGDGREPMRHLGEQGTG
jgi:carboxypeptidase D